MTNFVIDPNELSNSFGGSSSEKKALAKASETHQAYEKQPDVLSVLQTEYEKTLERLKADQQNAEKTTDPAFREELLARIPRIQSDLEGLNKEIVRAGGSAFQTESKPVNTNEFQIDPLQLKNSFSSNNNVGENYDLNFGASNLRTLGSPKISTADLMADYVHGLEPGTTSEIKTRLSNTNPVADVANAVASERNPAPLDPGHQRWLNARTSQPVPKGLSDQMITMTGGANVEGSGENVLAKHNAAIQKLKAMGYDPLTIPKQGDLLVPESGPPRPKVPSVWHRPRAIGPAPWTSTQALSKPATTSVPITTQAPEVNVGDEALRMQKAHRLSKPLATLGKILHYGGITAGAYDTARRAGVFNKPGDQEGIDPTGAVISGLGTVAQAAAPYVPAAAGAISGPLSLMALPIAATALPLINMARDRERHLAKHPEEHMFNPVVDGITYGPMGEPYR